MGRPRNCGSCEYWEGYEVQGYSNNDRKCRTLDGMGYCSAGNSDEDHDFDHNLFYVESEDNTDAWLVTHKTFYCNRYKKSDEPEFLYVD